MSRFLRKLRRTRSVNCKQKSFLEALPLEIFQKILEYLHDDECGIPGTRGKNLYLQSLISLAKCSKTLQRELLVPVVYRQVVLACKRQVERFFKALSKGYIRMEIVDAVETIIFEQVTSTDLPHQVSIASYSYNTDSLENRTYQELMIGILKRLPNVNEVGIANMAPRFQFRNSRPSVQVRVLSVSSDPGRRVYLQSDMFDQFPNVTVLRLQDIVLNSDSLKNVGSKIISLKLTDCVIQPTAFSAFSATFSSLKSLSVKIKSRNQTKLLMAISALSFLTDLTVEISNPTTQTDLLFFLDEKYNSGNLPKLEKLTLIGVTPSLLNHAQFARAIEKMAIKELHCHLVERPDKDVKLQLTRLYFNGKMLET